MKYFVNFNLSNFWEESEYALKEYVEDYPSDELIKSIESELNYKLPNSYVSLMKLQNGGIPKTLVFPLLVLHHGRKTISQLQVLWVLDVSRIIRYAEISGVNL